MRTGRREVPGLPQPRQHCRAPAGPPGLLSGHPRGPTSPPPTSIRSPFRVSLSIASRCGVPTHHVGCQIESSSARG